jgi:hypothetical protein
MPFDLPYPPTSCFLVSLSPLVPLRRYPVTKAYRGKSERSKDYDLREFVSQKGIHLMVGADDGRRR